HLTCVPEPAVVVRELAELDLAYLFPVASKFRSGVYNGQVQYRLNGWGRALAVRLAAGCWGAALAEVGRRAIKGHLLAEREQYQSLLSELDAERQDYPGDLLDRALMLPIPVLV